MFSYFLTQLESELDVLRNENLELALEYLAMTMMFSPPIYFLVLHIHIAPKFLPFAYYLGS